MNPPETRRGIRKGFALALLGAAVLLLAAIFFLRPQPAAAPVASSPPTPVTPVRAAKAVAAARPAARIPAATLEEKLGLEVASVRLTAAGRALDVRYRVVDEKKAAALDTRENMAYVIDEATGAQVGTSQPPPPLELNKPTPGRIYSAMFPNPGGALKSGSKVTLVVGEAHAKDLTVE